MGKRTAPLYPLRIFRQIVSISGKGAMNTDNSWYKKTRRLQVAGLFGHVDDRSPAEALADLGVGSRPEQLEIIVVDLLVARRHAASVLPAFALRGVGAGDEGRTVEDVLLCSLSLAVRAADFG